MSLEEIRDDRIKKLNLLKERGINPYPLESKRTISIYDFLSCFEAVEESEKEHWLSGRVMAVRGHGALIFADIFDGTGKMQVYMKADEIGEEAMSLFENTVDLGDFVEVCGKAVTTKRGEESILAEEWRMLSKSLLPLPEKWHGLQDEEARLRKRYLDLLFNEEQRHLFHKKALFWRVIEHFLEERGFLSVETPTLELTTGGAEARPFKTHHNDFDLDVYLRISVGELWQKRLMAAGFPKTYEIGRVYRNEGSSPEHLQEFSNMEFYAAYMNFDEGKELVKELYREIATTVFGTTEFNTRGHSFDLSASWEELDYVETVKEMTGVDVLAAREKELEEKLKELDVEYEGQNRERMIDSLWKYCRRKISGPAFLINHPKLVAPLSKEHPENPELTKTFQVIIAGSELGRAHAELNNPLDQSERFRVQEKMLDAGDAEAMMPDYEYVEAMEYGMPPMFGFGCGDRLFAYLTDKSVRETQLFPLLKPKN